MSDIVAFSPVRAIDKNGKQVSGALATFFASGTTAPVTVYSDVNETVPHPSPLVADSRGVFPPVYRGGTALRVVVTDPDGVTLPGFPVDPAITVSALGSGASEISFNATGDIPETNVQAAIERVQANLVEPLLAGGIGVTGVNTLLSNLNATDTPSGFFRFDATTTGDRPAGWAADDTGVVSFLRENSNSGLMTAIRRDDAGLWHRRLNAGTWAAWVRVVDSGQEQAQATWEAGASTTESTVSPAKVRAAIDTRGGFRTGESAAAPIAQGQIVQNTRSVSAFYSISVRPNNSSGGSVFLLEWSGDGSNWIEASSGATAQGVDAFGFSIILRPGTFWRVRRISGANTAATVKYFEVF